MFMFRKSVEMPSEADALPDDKLSKFDAAVRATSQAAVAKGELMEVVGMVSSPPLSSLPSQPPPPPQPSSARDPPSSPRLPVSPPSSPRWPPLPSTGGMSGRRSTAESGSHSRRADTLLWNP